MRYIYLPLFNLSGTLLRKLEAGVRGISHIFVDEIHERDLNVSTFYQTTNQPMQFMYAF